MQQSASALVAASIRSARLHNTEAYAPTDASPVAEIARVHAARGGKQVAKVDAMIFLALRFQGHVFKQNNVIKKVFSMSIIDGDTTASQHKR